MRDTNSWMLMNKNIFYHLFIFLLLASCMQPPANNQKTSGNGGFFDNPFTSNSNSNSNNQIQILNYNQSLSFFVLGNQSITGQMNLNQNFNDAFQLKGNELAQFLELNQSLTRLCLVTSVNTGIEGHKNLILAGSVRRIINFVSGRKENFLQFTMSSANSSADCGSLELLNTIESFYQNNQHVYSIQNVCPNCSYDLFSTSVRLYRQNGQFLTNINTNNLSFALKAVSSSNTSTSNQNTVSCSSASTCLAQGYDCCQQGQCVKNGSLKSGVDPEDEDFLQVQALLNLNPALYVNYPEYYFICGTQTVTTPNHNTATSGDPVIIANYQLELMMDLHQCTSPNQDGVSICPRYFKNASQLIDRTDPFDPEGHLFETGYEDQNFSYNPMIDSESSSVFEIRYGGSVLYKEGLIEANPNNIEFDEDSFNDDLDTAEVVNIKAAKPLNAVDDTLVIRFKVNGSCEKINASLARCKARYVQGQESDPPRPSDHDSDDNTFRLPLYASLSHPVQVRVNGVNISPGQSSWQLDEDEDDYPIVEFQNTIFPNQIVEITYFVADDQAETLLKSKSEAQKQVDTFCNCGDLGCKLQPVFKTNETTHTEELKAFNCVYPQITPSNVPLQQVVYVSSKSVPHRYFDEFGVNYDENRAQASGQEGNLFRYINNNDFRPNNLEENIGFNEIYGSFTNATNSARPAQMVKVVRGRTYDLYVDSGSFSTCLNCGSDYYSNLQKVFPGNFSSKGGGYTPDFVETRRFDNPGVYKADDLLFGRACFLPATMLPFSHFPHDDVYSQRNMRQALQHFYFANGYQRDWFGFDYGSMIGSFDGVKWFSIGNARRIKADSNKLFIAINAYFGDLTINSSYKVVVSEVTMGLNSGLQIDHDMKTQGAQCQQHHICDTDNDCIRNLGYEYSCEAVSGITSLWPSFDLNANEIPGSFNPRLITSLVGGTNAKPKRCVYRSRGAPCLLDYEDTSESYTGNSLKGLHQCAPNYRCQPLGDEEAFNNRISRFPRSPSAQNASSFVQNTIGAGDTFGLSARVLGRPLNYFGPEEMDEDITEQMIELGIPGICVPGKSDQAQDLVEAHSLEPEELHADRTLGIGITSIEEWSESMYSLCPATNEQGHYLSKVDNYPLDHPVLKAHAASQNISSMTLAHEDFENLNIFNNLDDLITKKGLNYGSCLRAPGAACFTDLDCAPNKFISDQVSKLTQFSLNEAEVNFWKEDLVCGQAQPKYLPLSTQMNPDYDLNKNKCCREIGKEITIYSGTHEESEIYTNKIAGMDLDSGDEISINDEKRYSRVHTVYDKMRLESQTYPALIGPLAGELLSQEMPLNSLLRQYNTFHLAASRTCCSSNWVRNFAQENGGGHHWVEGKTQDIPKETFECISWFADNQINISGTNQIFQCSENNWNSQECEIRNLSQNDERFYLNWVEKFELIGIPQIPIENKDYMHCLVGNLQQAVPSKPPLPNTIKANAPTEIRDGNNQKYYSAGNKNNFESNIKKIFSDNKVSCCLPAGQNVSGQTTDNECCTGKKFQNRCCLEDYTDITLYLNRYISSEAAHLPDNQIDPVTGYIKNPGTVMQIAQQKNICCSGKMAFGSAISSLMIPGVEFIPEARVNRFIYNNSLSDNNDETGNIGSIYDKGVRWNNHVYCVPSNFQDPREN